MKNLGTNELLHINASGVQGHHLREIAQGVTRVQLSEDYSKDYIDDAIAEFYRTGLYTVDDNGVALINISGRLYASLDPFYEAIMFKGSLFTYENISLAFQKAQSDSNVRVILVNCDSPGGDARGCSDCAQVIRQCTKEVHVFVGPGAYMTSAALEICSGANSITVSKLSIVGSIGTIMFHVEYSKMLEKEGYTVTKIASGEMKGSGNPYETLTPEAKAWMQSVVDAYTEEFVDTISLGRGLGLEAVQKLATGACWLGRDAVGTGLVDKLGTAEGLYQSCVVR